MPNIKLKIIPAPKIKRKSYIAKNEELKRALSPHLSIYKPQISSMMSIALRMTGLALAAITWSVAVTALLSDHNVEYYINELQKMELNAVYWKTIRTMIAFPFAFHFVSGVRHLLFDTAKLTEKNEFFITGCVAITLSIILALCLANIEQIREYLEKSKNTGNTE